MKVPSHEKKSNNYLSNHTAVANTNSVMNGTTKSGMDSTGNPHNKPNAIFSNRLIQQSIKPVNGKQVAELNNYRTQGRHDKKEDNPNNNKVLFDLTKIFRDGHRLIILQLVYHLIKKRLNEIEKVIRVSNHRPENACLVGPSINLFISKIFY